MVAAHPHIDPTAGLACKYDPWKRLVDVSDGHEVVAQYEYDGLNRRIVKKSVAGHDAAGSTPR